MMLSFICQNYELSKLQVSNPNMVNMFIFLFLLAITVVTTHKDASEVMNRSQTNQLKGVAIIFVILGHLWVHVSKTVPAIIFSGEAVSIFFFLSGYGLTLSNQKKALGVKGYLERRVKRVMLPYWMITVVIMLIDYVLLSRTYSIKDTIFTIAGINVTPITCHIDYVRWYITLLLVWYLLFFLIKDHLNSKNGIIFLFSAALTLFLSDYYIFHFGWYQLFSFPCGCIAAKYNGILRKILVKRMRLLLLVSLLMFCLYITYKVYFISILSMYVPWVIYKFLSEIFSVMFSFCFIIFISVYGYYFGKSNFLHFFGVISYELFLLHGAFLIKYNPIISSGNVFILPGQFFLFLFFICIITLMFRSFYQLMVNRV